MQQFYGVYRGVTSVDRSPIGLGEMEVTISSLGIAHRIATGTRIVTDAIPLARARELTTQEVGGYYKPNMSLLGSKGIKIGNMGIVLLRKVAIPGDETPQVVLCGMPFESEFGRTELFAPAQVRAGLFTRYLWALEATNWPGCVPILENEGKPKSPTRL